MQTDNEMVQDAAVNAFTAIAKLSKEHIEKNYDFSMPYLIITLVNANDKSNLMLRGNALECISTVSMVVGKEKFRDDLKQVMEVLKSIQESQVKEFGTVVFCLEACCRICMCMGKEFLPYISTVMPPLTECAQLEPNRIVFSDELEDRYAFFHRGLAFSIISELVLLTPFNIISGESVGFLVSSFATKGLAQAKSLACDLLSLYAHELEEDFYQWISEAAPVLVPLLKFYMDIDVRKNASKALCSLLHSAELAVEKGTTQGGNRSYFKQLCGDIIMALGDALYTEPETEVCASIMLALNVCLEICGPPLNEDQVHSIIDEIKHVITESSHNRGELTEREKSENFDAEGAELLMKEIEKAEEVFSSVGGILSTLIKTLKAAFLPFLDELSSSLMPMMVSFSS
ncbi:hypothetical protein HAX54_000437 [Datura stramonium]|uniref:Uncharacterized protein n=1 Tax=Datura stramonium TaxID=4076 RepID=A0ABS8T120_DATST|nr:hypothetical protein [Datura stramonium]